MAVEVWTVSTITINLEDDVAAMLQRIHEPIEGAVREMVALELYRRGVLSSGKAAQLLGTDRIDFIKYASRLGIPSIDMTPEEWEAERAVVSTWPRS